MTNEAKTLLGIGLVTLILLIGGIMALSKSSLGGTPQVADPAVLVREDSHSIAVEEPRVTVVEFGDFQCPYCGQAHPIIKELLALYPEVTFVARHFPLVQHPHAPLAAQVAEAAGAQGKYWEMYDLLYTEQDFWSGSSEPMNIFREYAQRLELDLEQFDQEIAEQTHLAKVQRDVADGNALGVNSTPTFFVDNERFNGSLQQLIVLIESKFQEE